MALPAHSPTPPLQIHSATNYPVLSSALSNYTQSSVRSCTCPLLHLLLFCSGFTELAHHVQDWAQVWLWLWIAELQWTEGEYCPTKAWPCTCHIGGMPWCIGDSRTGVCACSFLLVVSCTTGNIPAMLSGDLTKGVPTNCPPNMASAILADWAFDITGNLKMCHVFTYATKPTKVQVICAFCQMLF